jgi:YVTN family beta-propeller protein
VNGMDGMDRQLRELLEAAVGEPPRKISIETVRRRMVRRRAIEYVSGAAAVAVIAALVPASIGALGHGPAAPQTVQGPARGPIAYVTNFSSGTVTPIRTATNTALPPVKVGRGPVAIAITP